jgi:demethylmenaquinone methyltransferase/2-methoxy-6-polyprenyl-1,4-benzoquinol methylase
MSTYVLMRILESAPHRYDLGIRLLTLGAVGKAYDRLIVHIEENDRVLDVGCGTGALTLRAAERGANVKGIDVNAEMIAVAKAKVGNVETSGRVELEEKGVAELDHEPSETYDVVMSGLCLSELSEDELRYVLQQALRVLKPGGLLLVADEVPPANMWLRWVHRLLRLPLTLAAYLISGETTRPLDSLPGRVEEAGFIVESMATAAFGSFMEVVATKPTTS